MNLPAIHIYQSEGQDFPDVGSVSDSVWVHLTFHGERGYYVKLVRPFKGIGVPDESTDWEWRKTCGCP